MLLIASTGLPSIRDGKIRVYTCKILHYKNIIQTLPNLVQFKLSFAVENEGMRRNMSRWEDIIQTYLTYYKYI